MPYYSNSNLVFNLVIYSQVYVLVLFFVYHKYTLLPTILAKKCQCEKVIFVDFPFTCTHDKETG